MDAAGADETGYVVGSGDSGTAAAAVDAVRQLAQGVNHLDLHFSGLAWDSEDGRIGLTGIVRTAMTSERLILVDLSLNAIGPDGVSLLASSLLSPSAACRLRHLILNGCSAGSGGGIALGNALGDNTSLLELQLGNNAIEEEGGRALAQALRTNLKLRKLDLHFNKLRGSCADIARAMRHNTSLKSLSLRENFIPASCAKHLGRAIRDNESLRVLDLRANDFDDSSQVEHDFLPALLSNPCLERIRFTRFDLSLSLYRGMIASMLEHDDTTLSAIKQRLLTDFQLKHFVFQDSAREWNAAHAAGRALAQPPLEIAVPRLPEQRSLLAAYFDLMRS